MVLTAIIFHKKQNVGIEKYIQIVIFMKLFLSCNSCIIFTLNNKKINFDYVKHKIKIFVLER